MVANTSYDGINVNSPTATAILDDVWFDRNLSAMSVYRGTLKVGSVIVSDAGFYGLFVEGDGNAWITNGSNEGGFLSLAEGRAYMTVPPSDGSGSGGFCVYDTRPSSTSGYVRIDGRMICAPTGPGPGHYLPAPADKVGPLVVYTPVDAGLINIVNGATVFLR